MGTSESSGTDSSSPATIREPVAGWYGCVWEGDEQVEDPYPGFKADAYQGYSEPVFGTRKVLRGGAWAIRGRMVNNMYRNYFTPERRDVFAGFRTCVL